MNVVYHGSPYEIRKLTPQTTHGDPGIPAVVFASSSRTFALAYVGKKWGDRDIEQMTRGGKKAPFQMRLREMRPGALEDIYNTSGYLYTLPEKTFSSQNRRSNLELISEDPIKPIQVQKILNVLHLLKKQHDVKLLKYNPKHKDTERALNRTINRMKGMSPYQQEKYRTWCLEEAPTEIKKLWKAIENKNISRMYF